MRVQTPFYVIKRTAVTKVAAAALAAELSGNADSVLRNLHDMIDFCFSDPKEEKVFLFLGDKVRLKENAGWQHGTPYTGEAVFNSVCLDGASTWLQFDTADDFNTVRTDNMDLSAYVELI